MKKFLTMLLAVLFCTTAMCFTDVLASTATSVNTKKTDDKSNNKTVQESIQDINSTAVNSNNGAYSDEEVYLTAQLVWHEAHNQSYNGKVAIAEVVLNRVKSGLFPNTVSGVINQSGQFINSRRLKNVNPTEQELRIAYNVLNGDLRTFNDSDVLYFRNPKVTCGVAASVDKDWGSLDYVSYIGDHAFYSQEEKTVTVADNTTATESNKTSFLDKLPSALSIGNVISKVKQVAESKHVNKANAITEQPSEDTTNEMTPEQGTNDIEVVNTAQVSEVAVNLIQMNETLTVEQAMQQAEFLIAQVNSVQALSLETEGAEQEAATDTEMNGASNSVSAIDTVDMESDNNDEGDNDAKNSDTHEIDADNRNVDVDVEDKEDNYESDSDSDSDLDSEEVKESEEQQILEYVNAIAIEKAKAAKDEDNLEDEEIDENDPAAKAQRQAKIDAKRQLREMEKLEAENAKANEAATKLANQNVNEAVQRADLLVKLGQPASNVQ